MYFLCLTDSNLSPRNLIGSGIFSLLFNVAFFMFQIRILNNDINVIGYKKSLCIYSGITFVLQTSVFVTIRKRKIT
jgi:hypothetical protein